MQQGAAGGKVKRTHQFGQNEPTIWPDARIVGRSQSEVRAAYGGAAVGGSLLAVLRAERKPA